MAQTRLTRDGFLWAMSMVYLSAFASLYHQMPGLYGDHGVLPMRAVIPIDSNTRPPQELAKRATQQPSLLWLAPNFGLKVATMAEFLALLGIVMSLLASVSSRFRDCINYSLLWILYFSLYQVGQTFMWFQWDILLLEAGFLCILVAPLGIFHRTMGLSSSWRLPHHPHDTITLWLVRWLLFRLMFASGVVKLTSECPTWWGLTALNYHFESQCIPTPLAWYFHQLANWVLRLGVVFTYVIEIAIPFLFFAPIRSLRIFSFYSQMFLQLMIIVTGNYNFFNLLTMTLCLSLVDDDFLLGIQRRSGKPGKLRTLANVAARTIALAVYCGLFYGTVKLFHLRFDNNWALHSKIGFTSAKFNQFLGSAMPILMWVAAASLAFHILVSFYRSLVNEKGVLSKIFSTLGTIIMGTAAVWVFCISLVPLSQLDAGMNRKLWPTIRTWHYKVEPFHLTSPYGLFRRMTGVGGRPELVLEGSDDPNGPWVELPFLYKPGDVNRSPPFIIPHQPRLDWQMWFAALSDYRQNPWLVSLVYRLLNDDASVRRLLNVERYPFTRRPPKYIRGVLYKYWYTKMDMDRPYGGPWWHRGSPREYLPPVHKEQPFLRDFLRENGIPMDSPRVRSKNKFLTYILKHSRTFAENMSPRVYVWSLISTALLLNFVQGLF